MEETEIQTVPFADIRQQLCQKLNCSALADDLERVNYAREMLAKLQQTEAFSQLMGDNESETPVKLIKTSHRTSSPSSSEIDISLGEDLTEDRSCDNFSADAWLGFFKGYQILSENQAFSLNENNHCIQISHNDCDAMLGHYLRAGVRCFAIDLFHGTELDNQKLIFKLRENELKISQEYGFPIATTLIALLSPRCQYTGVLIPMDAVHEMNRGEIIVLTTARQYSMSGTRDKVYVNARFLLDDCKLGDFILIGPNIQLQIIALDSRDLRCLVMEPGQLHSRQPVRFPSRCNHHSISVEEIEDITFAREVGINVMVSYIPGTIAYFEDLCNVLRLLDCDKLRLCCRVVLNEITDDGSELQSVADRYDGFLIDFSAMQQQQKCNEDPHNLPAVLDLSPSAVQFIQKVFQLKKPIIMNGAPIGDCQLFVAPCNISQIFYYPDKYLFKCDHKRGSLYFKMLQNALVDKVPELELSNLPYCDESSTGSDSIARSCIATSFESHAMALLVCSIIPDMAIKLSHFRPKAPIVYISPTKSTADYISMYHNIVYLYFPARGDDSTHRDYLTRGLTFGLLYLKCRKFIKNDQNVVLVYGTDPGTKLLDKYLLYKFDEAKFPNHLYDILLA